MAPAFWLRQTASSSSSSRHSRRRRDVEQQHVNDNDDKKNADEKTPLLSGSPSADYTGLPALDLPPRDAITPTDVPWRRRLRHTLLVLLIISIVVPTYNFIRGLPAPRPFHPPYNPTPPPVDPSLQSRTFAYGINVEKRYSNFFLNISEQLDPAHFPAGLVGKVHVLTGELYQSHSLNVYVQISSVTPSPLNRIVPARINPPNGAEILQLTSSSPYPTFPPIPSAEPEHSTTVNVYIYTRPHTLQFNDASISTNTLNITLGPWTFYEVYNLRLSSTRGNIHSSIPPRFLQYFTAHDINITASHGNITGIWSLPGTFTASAGKHVDIDLHPKRWSFGPSARGEVTIAATNDIKVWMPLTNGTLSLRNSTIDLLSREGDIDTNLVLGAVMKLSAPNGGIRARLLPYWSYWKFQKHVYPPLLETSAKGDTDVFVEKAHIMLPGDPNPLQLLRALHTTEQGSVVVRYPVGGWTGTARVESVEGTAAIEVPQGMEKGIVREGDKVVKWTGEENRSVVKVKAGGDAKFELWRED